MISFDYYKSIGLGMGITTPHKNAPCFAPLMKCDLKKGDQIVYHVKPHSSLTEEEILFYYSRVQRWGFPSVLKKSDDRYSFTIDFETTFIRLLCNLCFLRYLEEEPFQNFVKSFNMLAKNFPDHDTFKLIQLAHYLYINSYNYNHTFLPSIGNVYGDKSVTRLIDLKTFHKNIDNWTKPPAVWDTGLNSVMLDSNNLVLNETVRQLSKKKDYKGLLEFLS